MVRDDVLEFFEPEQRDLGQDFAFVRDSLQHHDSRVINPVVKERDRGTRGLRLHFSELRRKQIFCR